MVDVETLFGKAYLTTEEFREMTDVFGVDVALSKYPEGDAGDNRLLGALAAASRTIDAACNRGFGAEEIQIENHTFNTATRRIKVNSPPVVELLEFKIRTAPGSVSSFNVSDVFVNHQENYLELTSLALGGSLTTPLLSLGMNEPQAEIRYKSFAKIPQKIKLACGYQAAWSINQSYVNSIAPPNYKIESGTNRSERLKVENTTKRNAFEADSVHFRLAPGVRDLLSEFIRIPIG
ncbi:MAG TPA: hypothetical protein VF648_00590 [Pyrinomonadaceae bacterium]|jgi:hypothetical protein